MLEAFSWEEIGSSFMILFAIIGVLSNIPVIIEVKKKFGKKLSAFRSVLFASLIMFCFLIFGENVLSFIGVDIKSFAVAGALVLFTIALEMVLDIKIGGKNQDNINMEQQQNRSDPSIVPLAFPLIAGAGSMTTILSLKAQYQELNIGISIFLNMILVYFTLTTTDQIEKILGPGGIAVMKKLFGIILLSIAIKLFTNNLKYLFAL